MKYLVGEKVAAIPRTSGVIASDTLQATIKEHSGYTKEIDHILQRVVAIEKHLGIKQRANTN